MPVTLPQLDTKSLPLMLKEADRLPLLITGIAGVSGFNAFSHFRERYGDQVTGQRPKNNWPLQTDGVVGIDLEDRQEIKRLVERGGFRSVINCGGSCALKACELDPQMAHRVNVDGIDSLLSAIEDTEIRFVHLSIDLVYSGKGVGGHVESDEPDPVTVYGSTMVSAERLVLSRMPQACVARISLPMGISFNGHAGAIDWIQHRFASNRPATLYFDEIRTPTYVECMNEVYERLLSGDSRGLFHAGGTRKLSLYQIAQIVNRVGGYDPDLLIGCPRIDAGPMPPRAGNVSMNSEKLSRELGFAPFLPWPFDSEHVPKGSNLSESVQWHYDRSGFAGSPQLLQHSLYLRPKSHQE